MDHAELRIEVAYCPNPHETDLQTLVLMSGATVADAVQASGFVSRHGLDAAALRLGVWGRSRAPEAPLRDRDRVEIYRALLVDPKEARRQRYRRHRDKTPKR